MGRDASLSDFAADGASEGEEQVSEDDDLESDGSVGAVEPEDGDPEPDGSESAEEAEDGDPESDGTEGAVEPEDDGAGEETIERDDSSSDDGDSPADAAVEPGSVTPAVVTASVGATDRRCARCDAPVRRRWRDDGEPVCVDCKSW